MKTFAPTSRFFVFEAAYERIIVKKMASGEMNETSKPSHLVHTNRFAIHFDHIHNLDCIVSIFLGHELYEPITLMLLRDPVTWHVHIDCGGTLHTQIRGSSSCFLIKRVEV